MASNGANIFAQPCHCYIKSRGATPAVETVDTAPTGWIDLGVMKEKTAKCSMKPKSIKVHYGSVQIGGEAEFKASALEVAAANITALEALKGSVIDIIMKPVAATETRVFKFLGMTPVIGADWDFGGEEPCVIDFVANATGVKNIGDVQKLITCPWSL